jgi:Ser/Thr protein kinase RdoA (MazF antagonist)
MTGEYAPEIVADLQVMVMTNLQCWDLSPRTEVRLLNLSENATFGLYDPATARDLVLRLHRVGYSSAAEIRSELAWINALRAQAIVDTPPPVSGRNGNFVQCLESPSGRPSRHAVAFERVSGKEPDQSDDMVRWFAVLGELTARMHLHVRTWTPPAGFRRKVWDFDAMVGPQGFWGPWRAGLADNAAGIALLERVLAIVERRVARYGRGPERFGLVHADLRLANLLVDGPHLRVIDFDDSGFSWFIYDFAAAVSFIEHEPIMPDLLRAWLVGYRKAAPLSAEEEAEIPTFVMLRRVLLTAWLASHAEIPYARQIGKAYTAGTVTLAEAFLTGQFLGAHPST